MNPSIDDRLAGLIRAMSDIILPALQSSGGLAQEQGQLVLGTLLTIRQQLDDAPRYERAEVAAAESLGKQLFACAQGGSETQGAAAHLQQAIEMPDGVSASVMRAKLEAIHGAIEQLIHASSRDGSEAFRERQSRLVLDYGKASANFARSWYRAMGFESANSAVPEINEMLRAYEGLG